MYIKTLFSGIAVGLVFFFLRYSHDLVPYIACIALAAVLFYFWVYDFVKPAKKLRATGLTVLAMIPLAYLAEYLSSAFWNLFPDVRFGDGTDLNIFITGALLLGVLWMIMTVFAAQKLKFLK